MRMLLIAGLLLASPAMAQQTQPTPDPVLLQRMLASTRADRNQLFDALTESQARASMVAEELAAAKDRIKELSEKADKLPGP
jgi:hypothetical protein